MNTVNENNAIDETISTTEVKKEESFLSVEVLSMKAVVGIKPSRLGGSFWYLEAVSFCRSVVGVEWLRGFRCLDACSLVGGAIWVGLGSVALLEELSVTHYSRFTLGFTLVVQDVSAQLPVPTTMSSAYCRDVPAIMDPNIVEP